MLTQERLKELLDYDSESGIFWRKITRSHNAKAGSIAGWVDDMGYVRISIDGRKYRGHQLVWLYVHGYIPEQDTDHMNQIRSDNRICNLRLATRSQNNQNRRLESRNTSGAKGVSWCKRRRKWLVQIMVDGKNKFVGYYVELTAAAAARKAAELQYHPYRAA